MTTRDTRKFTGYWTSRARIAWFVLATASVPAHAHSWYPKECCDDHDCAPANDMVRDKRGDWEVVVGRHRIWVPQHFQVRPSRDHRIHICYRLDENNYPMPLCLFLPAQS